MQLIPIYPTPQHAAAAASIQEYFERQVDIETLLLMGSTARGKASPESCLDFLVLVRPEILALHRSQLEQNWQAFYTTDPAVREMRQLARFTHVDLEFINGIFIPRPHCWVGGADDFELEIGNTLVYSVALFENSEYLGQLKAHWLPYYAEPLRQERLAMVRRYCLNNLEHIPSFIRRGLYFQSFNRLYDAFSEFLQALFIARLTYPIAYDKWVSEGVAEILGLPELYTELVHILEIPHFESEDIAKRAEDLNRLVDEYL